VFDASIPNGQDLTRSLFFKKRGTNVISARFESDVRHVNNHDAAPSARLIDAAR
jgi:hypothetical protein